MLRQILTTAVAILLPYLIYGIVELIRRRRQGPEVIEAGAFWSRAPVFALGVVGCLLAVIILVALAIYDTNPSNAPYIPPINQDSG